MNKSVWEWTVFNLMTDTAVLAEQQPSNDGQPDEAQEWADFDADC